jgi:hypothetical protein
LTSALVGGEWSGSHNNLPPGSEIMKELNPRRTPTVAYLVEESPEALGRATFEIIRCADKVIENLLFSVMVRRVV